MSVIQANFVFTRHIHKPLGWECLITYLGDGSDWRAAQKADDWVRELSWIRTISDVFTWRCYTLSSDDLKYQRATYLRLLNDSHPLRNEYPYLVEQVESVDDIEYGPSGLRTMEVLRTPAPFTIPSSRRSQY